MRIYLRPDPFQCLSAWWSFADPAGATEAQKFHIDLDDVKFCKLFIYLTDVDEDSGPHTYIGGSHDMELITKLRDQWPGGSEEFNKWYFNTLRKTDGQVKRIFGRDPTHLTGPRGTRFVADTFGVHKGVPPKKGERLVCQVEYGVSPLLKEPVVPLRMGSKATRHIPDSATTPPLDYVNRLFVLPAVEA